MNKKALAVALGSLVAVPAFAQSNVTLSGFVAVSYANYRVSDTLRPMATENRLDDAGSRFTLKGVEDLGGGLSAYFQIDNRINADVRPNTAYGNAQGLADGETFVGLKHKNLGSIGFGKFELHSNQFKGFSEFYRVENTQLYAGTNLLSKINATAIANASRIQNAVKYDTPNWGGFSGIVGYSFNPTGNEGNASYVNTGYATGSFAPAANNKYNKGDAWNVVGRYNNGPINAFVSYYEQTNEGADRAGQESYRLGGDYAFPFGLKVGLDYDNSKIIGATAAADTKRTAWMLPISYMTGAHGFYLTFAKANDRKVGGSKVANSGAKQWSLAYDYALSKRTIVGVSYMNLKNDTAGAYSPHNAGVAVFGGSNLNAGEDARQLSLNLTHRF
ncbi:MAG: porin [Betaproteobacteria bacterium]